MSKNPSPIDECEKKKAPKPPFKLCFSIGKEKGESYISLSRPLGIVHGVTDKFYTGKTKNPSKEVMENVKQLYKNGPREKYQATITESHRYGWYSDVSFVTPESHKKFNFNKNLNIMFKH